MKLLVIETRDKTKDAISSCFNDQNYDFALTPGQNEKVKEKVKQTMFLKYGYDHPQQVPEIKEKKTNTNIEKYGGRSPAASIDVRNKMKSTSLERYGETNYSKTTISKENSIIRNKNKRNRDIVKLILENTTRKQRQDAGLLKGWYQLSDEKLHILYDSIFHQN